jgi:hypothetical protein
LQKSNSFHWLMSWVCALLAGATLFATQDGIANEWIKLI